MSTTVTPSMASVIVLLGALLYLVVGLARPRLRSAGLSPWFLLLWLVPVANFATAILLFIAPPEKTSKPGGTDNTGTVPRNGAWLKSKKPIAIYAVTALAIAAALFFLPAGKAAHSTARETKPLISHQLATKEQEAAKTKMLKPQRTKGVDELI